MILSLNAAYNAYMTHFFVLRNLDKGNYSLSLSIGCWHSRLCSPRIRSNRQVNCQKRRVELRCSCIRANHREASSGAKLASKRTKALRLGKTLHIRFKEIPPYDRPSTRRSILHQISSKTRLISQQMPNETAQIPP